MRRDGSASPGRDGFAGRCTRKAFTLVEVLTYSSLLAILGAMIFFTMSLLSAWSLGFERTNTLNRELAASGRAVSADLMMARSDSVRWATTPERLTLLLPTKDREKNWLYTEKGEPVWNLWVVYARDTKTEQLRRYEFEGRDPGSAPTASTLGGATSQKLVAEGIVNFTHESSTDGIHTFGLGAEHDGAQAATTVKGKPRNR